MANHAIALRTQRIMAARYTRVKRGTHTAPHRTDEIGKTLRQLANEKRFVIWRSRYSELANSPMNQSIHRVAEALVVKFPSVVQIERRCHLAHVA